MDPRQLVMAISVGTSVLMLVGKLSAYWLTSSAAILADAAESVVHLAATAFAAFSLWYADQPADKNHPYGHGRVAFLSAGFEGALVCIASLAVVSSGVYDLWKGPQVERIGIGLVITSGLAVINLALGIALIRVGRSNNSIVLIANGRHVLTDVYTTAAAILGLLLVMATNQQALDPIAAIIIGFLIMYNGVGLIRSAVAGLMDELPEELHDRLETAIKNRIKDTPIEEYHAVRARRINDELWLDMHVLVEGSTTVNDAHAAVTSMEESLRLDFCDYHLRVNSHIEPLDHEAAHPNGE